MHREQGNIFCFRDCCFNPLIPCSEPMRSPEPVRSSSPAPAAGTAPAAAVTQRGPEQHRCCDLRCSTVCVCGPVAGRTRWPGPAQIIYRLFRRAAITGGLLGTGIAAEVSALPADTGCDSSASVLACCRCRGITAKGSATQGLGGAPGPPGMGLCCNLLCAHGAVCCFGCRLQDEVQIVAVPVMALG